MDFNPVLDPVLLARLQFAFTVTFHIIFPSFTIGLSAFIATLLVRWIATGREHLHRLARFWTKIFAVSFAMGVVSGIVLSYQFGTNWSRFSVAVGNVVAPLIGYEVLTAFFLEATFLGVMLFGWRRVPPWLHVFSAVVVAVGTAISAFWILSANSWMQTPAGHEVRGGIAYPVDWLEVIFNPSFPYRFAHMLTAAYLTTSLVVLAVGARYLLAQRHGDEARTMMRMAIGMLVAARTFAASDRRPARPQYARAPADQDRGHGGALGRQQAGRTRRCSPGRTKGRRRTASRSRSPRPARSSSPTASTAFIPGSRACRRPTGRRWCRCSSRSAPWWASAS